MFKNELKLKIDKYCYLDGFLKTKSWKNNSDCCSWDGITCVANFGYVIELNLTKSCVAGQLNSKSNLFRLQNFRFLDLSDNSFSGQISSSLGNFSKLTTVNLSYNYLIPSSLANFSHLKSLDLTGNDLIGQILSDFGRLNELVELYLGSNWFDGNFPVTLLNLTKLYALGLPFNYLTGTLPPNMTSLSNLEWFSVSFNAFTGTLPSSLFAIPNINTIYANENQLNRNIPSFICGFRSLSILQLSNNKFNGSIPGCFGNFSTPLEVLNLRKNHLSGGIPEILSEYLETLDVGHNQLVGKLPRSLVHIYFLEVLNVESNKINDTFPFWLSSLRMLNVLVLRTNAFRGPIQKLGFSELRIIDISGNHFSGTLPSDYFVNWTAMFSLGITGDESNKGYMGSAYYIDSMVLMYKGVEMKLEGILKMFTAIDFSGNKFEGDIPSSIGGLKDLHVLNLSNNAFSGHIPSKLADLIELESLDVSQNKLSGEIPQDLGNLSFLSYMDFSHNQLIGPIPGSTQFTTQPCSSFENNPGLFGPTLDRACGDKNKKTSQQSERPEQGEDEEEVISWIAAAIGVIPGISFGFTMGYILLSNKSMLFVKTFERNRR